MLKTFQIQNFKSLVDVQFEPGNLNVFIGENGCGKTNILEALAWFAEAHEGTIPSERLVERGVRIARESLTKSCFAAESSANAPIFFESNTRKFTIRSESGRWIAEESTLMRILQQMCTLAKYSGVTDLALSSLFDIFLKILLSEESQSFADLDAKNDAPSAWQALLRDVDAVELTTTNESEKMFPTLNKFRSKKEEVLAAIRHEFPDMYSIAKIFLDEGNYEEVLDDIKTVLDKLVNDESLKNYTIYSPETTILRGMDLRSHRQPLGLYGEGLDLLVHEMSDEQKEKLKEHSTRFVSWLEDFFVQDGVNHDSLALKPMRSKSNLFFKDRFLPEEARTFSSENVNEGVLFTIFHLALFLSDKTPAIFGVDNIETGLNPRLCRFLIKELAQISKDNNKQAFITTHHPAVLDGLNLNDDTQRLFVVYRDDDGHTQVKRITTKPEQKGDGPKLKLSEMWMRGMLPHALPDLD